MNKMLLPALTIVCLISSCRPDIDIKVQTPTPVESTPVAATAVETDMPPIAGDLGWGKIHGTITDAVTGELIVGALITCEHHSYTSPATCSGTVSTDEDGNYVFDKVFFHDTDTIKLTVESAGYQTAEMKNNFFTMADMEVNFALTQMP